MYDAAVGHDHNAVAFLLRKVGVRHGVGIAVGKEPLGDDGVILGVRVADGDGTRGIQACRQKTVERCKGRGGKEEEPGYRG